MAKTGIEGIGSRPGRNGAARVSRTDGACSHRPTGNRASAERRASDIYHRYPAFDTRRMRTGNCDRLLAGFRSVIATRYLARLATTVRLCACMRRIASRFQPGYVSRAAGSDQGIYPSGRDRQSNPQYSAWFDVFGIRLGDRRLGHGNSCCITTRRTAGCAGSKRSARLYSTTTSI